jgi:Flp pilus assembly protein TadD
MENVNDNIDFVYDDNTEPDSAKAYNYRGILKYQEGGNQDGAISDFTKAIKLDSNFAPAYSNRAGVYACKGEMDKALEDYEKAHQLDPKNPVIAENLERHRNAHGENRRLPPF